MDTLVDHHRFSHNTQGSKPFQLLQAQMTYLDCIKSSYYESYCDDNRRLRYSYPELIDKANLELKYIWE